MRSADASVKAADLYAEYQKWCEAAGERERLTKKAFGMRLEEEGFEQHRTSDARWWKGLSLRVAPQLFEGRDV